MPVATKTEHGAIGLRAMHALSARDMPGLRALLADDAVVEWPFAGRTTPIYHGGDTAMKMFSPINVFETFALTVTHIHELPDGATVIMEADSHGIFADSRPDYHNRYVFFLTIADAKVARWREYFNPVEGAKTFGRADARGQDPVTVHAA